MKVSLSINPKLETERILGFLNKVKKKTGINNVVLGMSGGIDSTTVFYLLKSAYKPENIYPVILNYYPKTNSTIKKIIHESGVPKENVLDISIKSIVDTLNELTTKRGEGTKFFSTWDADEGGGPTGEKKLGIKPNFNRMRLGNIMARVRMIFIFDLAKKVNGLVAGTENKSEQLLGYFTRFGDAASDLEPLAHLFKTQIYELAKYLQVPKEFIKKKPTAGLWDKQTDESEFGFTYKDADIVLHLSYDLGIDLKKIKKMGFRKAEKIAGYVKKNRFKRETPYSLPQKKAGL